MHAIYLVRRCCKYHTRCKCHADQSRRGRHFDLSPL